MFFCEVRHLIGLIVSGSDAQMALARATGWSEHHCCGLHVSQRACQLPCCGPRPYHVCAWLATFDLGWHTGHVPRVLHSG